MLKRFYNHSLIIFAISSMIILISVNLAISQKKQPEETVLNVLSNSGDQPNFTADPSFNRVSGSGWIYTDTVTIFIDDDYDLNNGWLHTVELLIDDSGEFLVWIEEEECEIQPGYIVTVTDGETTKVHEVTNIAVISVDKDLDTVSGIAEPFAQVRVDNTDMSNPATRHVTANADGYWMADYSVTSHPADIGIMDVVPGTDGNASEIDDDCDETRVRWEVSGPISVNIDIKPGSYPNSINLKSKGKIPVAILTTDTFDATTVNSATVNFGKTGTEASPVHYAMEDVDGDGGIDMIFHFKTQETGIECGDNSASLTGNTFSGQAIRGTDSIKTVKCK